MIVKKDLFRNRTALVRNLDATTPVATNFKEALTNKVKLEYLDHRAKLNEKVLKTSEDLAAVNKQLIEINRHVCYCDAVVFQHFMHGLTRKKCVSKKTADYGHQ